MSRKKKVTIITTALLALVLCSILIVPDHTNCQSPTILGNEEKADLIVADLVNQLGGLPKSGIDLAADQPVSQVSVYPVNNWEIETVTVGNTTSLLSSITDDDPVYAYTIDFRTFYPDGSQGRLRWSSWRYGLVVCPFVYAGDGPSGRLEILPDSG